MKFDSKVSTIEEARDLELLTMEELHGILTTYEMRVDKGKGTSRHESTFKVTKKTKTKGFKSCICLDNESDTKEMNFVRDLKRGLGKFKGKLPFKCLNSGQIRHFVGKCPYPGREDSDDEEENDNKKGSKPYRNKRGKHAKNKSFRG